jgi:hypothetical protein
MSAFVRDVMSGLDNAMSKKGAKHGRVKVHCAFGRRAGNEDTRGDFEGNVWGSLSKSCREFAIDNFNTVSYGKTTNEFSIGFHLTWTFGVSL